MQKNIIEGTKTYLRPLEMDDVSKSYVGWLNDPEVNGFLESRFLKQTKTTVKKYVSAIKKDKNYLFLAIVIKDGGKHIGNIKLGPINKVHGFAEIGILIGDKSSWGKGYATEAIKLLVNHAFKNLGLRKLTAGCYETNVGSIKAFQKAGFLEEGRFKKHYAYNGKYLDRICLALFKTE